MRTDTPATLRYRVVIPVLNQLAYTQQCIESLLAGGTPAQAWLVIDNATPTARRTGLRAGRTFRACATGRISAAVGPGRTARCWPARNGWCS